LFKTARLLILLKNNFENSIISNKDITTSAFF
jgi:hypothetical protein